MKAKNTLKQYYDHRGRKYTFMGQVLGMGQYVNVYATFLRHKGWYDYICLTNMELNIKLNCQTIFKSRYLYNKKHKK